MAYSNNIKINKTITIELRRKKMKKFIQSGSYAATFAFVMSGFTVSIVPNVANAQGQFEIEEIVVTARKREESLQEVPVAITVFTGQALEQEVFNLLEIYLQTLRV